MSRWERVRESAGGFVVTVWVGLAAIVALFGTAAYLQSHADTSEVCTSTAEQRVPDADCTAHRPGDTSSLARSVSSVSHTAGHS